MKIILTLIMVTLLTTFSSGQTSTYIGKHTRSNKVQSKILIDSLTGTKFVLDTAQINITAMDVKGDTLWQTDPWKDNNLSAYRVQRPIIVYYDFANSKRTYDKEVIWIIYNNSQFGIVEKESGNFTFFGQD